MDAIYNRMTDDLRAILARARREAGTRHAAFVDVEHLMLGLLKHQGGTAYEMLKYFAADTNALYMQIAAGVGVERGDPIEIKGLTHAAEHVMVRAESAASELSHQAIDSGHLLIALMDESAGLVHEALAGTSLNLDGMRDFMRDATPKAAPTYAPTIGRPIRSPRRRAPSVSETEFVLIPTRKQSRTIPPGRPQQAIRQIDKRIWIAAGIALLIAYMIFALPGNSLFTFVFVFVGWIFSLTLHEFSHALVAYWGGDHTVRDKGYLTFNPLKYTHPMLSVVMPLLFLAMGGIGLPGGAVYIERHRLRSQWWGSAVSAAGPTANLLFAILLAVPFFTGIVDVDSIITKIVSENQVDAILRDNPDLTEDQIYKEAGVDTSIRSNITLWSAVAFLAVLQVTAVLLNLIPIPPLDGFGIIEPFLDERTRQTLRQFGFMGGILLVFLLLWMVKPVERQFWNMVYDTTDVLEIPNWLGGMGYDDFMFWREPPS